MDGTPKRGEARVQAALVILAAGDFERLHEPVEAHFRDDDWREALVGAGLAGDHWREKLDAALATPTS